MDIDTNILKDLEKEFGSNIEPDLQGKHEDKVLRFTPLFNGTVPQVQLKREKPQHRLIAILKSSGLDNQEIAEMTGYTAGAISTIISQPFAQDVILGRMHESGDKAMELLQAASVKAAERLIVLAEHAKNEECKRKANNDILDRKYGKPNQPYTVSERPVNEMSDQELAKVVQN